VSKFRPVDLGNTVCEASETRFADEVFWKAALDYCVAGNLQAVLDEYGHALTDWAEDRPATITAMLSSTGTCPEPGRPRAARGPGAPFQEPRRPQEPRRAVGLASDDPWAAMFRAAPAADAGMQSKETPDRTTRTHAADESRRAASGGALTAARIYRLAFGQPRQDELLGALQRVPDLDGRLHELLIDLSPASGAARRMSSQLTQRGFDLVERGWWL